MNRKPDKRRCLGSSDVFCMMPWVQLHIRPEGELFPCCHSRGPVGYSGESSLAGQWNSEDFWKLRRNMMTGVPSPQCESCYEIESYGGWSPRRASNQTYARHWKRVLRTDGEGFAPEMKLARIDFRFSNACNFKCRSCGPHLSSAWSKEISGPGGSNGLLRAPGTEKVLQELEGSIEHLESVYFAGGEPTLSIEHYRILDMLRERKLFHVGLSYSTNLSKLSYRDWDLPKIWKQFESVTLFASIDASGARAEYLRKGTNWEEIVKNRKKLARRCPNVKMFITTTVSTLNALHVPDLHESWIDSGMIAPGFILMNPVREPKWYRIQALPASLKKKVRERYQAHMGYLMRFLTKKEHEEGPILRSIWQYQITLNFMEQEDRTRDLPRLREVTRLLDKTRGESFNSVFPEMAELGI